MVFYASTFWPEANPVVAAIGAAGRFANGDACAFAELTIEELFPLHVTAVFSRQCGEVGLHQLGEDLATG